MQFLTTADLASSTCHKTQQNLSILLLPTDGRAYNTSSFLYPNTVLTAFGNSRQYTGSSESKDGTHIEVAALTAPVTAHATIGAHVPESCVAVRGLRRRPKQGTAASLVKAAAVAGAKSRSLCRKPSYPAALVGLHGRSVPFAHRRGTVPAAPCLQCLALGRVRPPKRNVGDRTAVAICRVDFYFGLCARLGRRSLDSHLLAALLCVVGRGAGGPLHRSRQHHGYSPAGNGSPCPPSAGSSLHVANRQPASSVKSVAQRPQHADNR